MVSEGTMEISGEAGSYVGRLSVGGIVAVVRRVEPGPGHMRVEADTGRGIVVLRLATDGEFFSGNWVMGAQRGTATAEKRRPYYEGDVGPVSTGSSSRPPHSDHEPS